MEWITEFSDYIRWLCAAFLYPIFLLIIPDSNEITKLRKTIYLIALPLFCIQFALGHVLTDIYRDLSQPVIISIIVFKSALSGIVFSEITRSITKRGKLWDTKKHLLAFLVITATFTSIRVAAVQFSL